MSLQAMLRAQREDTERWMDDRRRDLEEGAARLHARGRQAYAEAVRSGHYVRARTESEVRALGKVAREQGGAAVRGAIDEASFGLADRVAAGVRAVNPHDFAGTARRYRDGMATERAKDAYDEKHYGAARAAGRVAGGVASVAATGGIAGAAGKAALKLAPRGVRLAAAVAKPVVKDLGLHPEGLQRMAAGGGLIAGVVDQAVGDIASRHLSSPQDYLGAATGGAVGGLTTLRHGARAGGAVTGGATSLLQGTLKGDVSLDEVLTSARAGAALGEIGSIAGSHGVAGLSPRAKGAVGDRLSDLKTLARGERPVLHQKRLPLKGGGYTVTDSRVGFGKTPKKVIESKMGPTARLSPRQQQAARELKERYLVDHWQFSDVGKAAGAAFAPLGSQRRGGAEP